MIRFDGSRFRFEIRPQERLDLARPIEPLQRDARALALAHRLTREPSIPEQPPHTLTRATLDAATMRYSLRTPNAMVLTRLRQYFHLVPR